MASQSKLLRQLKKLVLLEKEVIRHRAKYHHSSYQHKDLTHILGQIDMIKKAIHYPEQLTPILNNPKGKEAQIQQWLDKFTINSFDSISQTSMPFIKFFNMVNNTVLKNELPDEIQFSQTSINSKMKPTQCLGQDPSLSGKPVIDLLMSYKMEI